MSKNVARTIATLAICLLLCGCTPPKDYKDFKVVDKDYEPAYTVLMPFYNGKNISVIPTYYPEKYYLIVEGISEDGETRQRKVQVSAVDYENATIGQRWERGLQ